MSASKFDTELVRRPVVVSNYAYVCIFIYITFTHMAVHMSEHMLILLSSFIQAYRDMCLQVYGSKHRLTYTYLTSNISHYKVGYIQYNRVYWME